MSYVTKKRSPSPPDLRKILKEIAAVDAPKTIDLRSLVEEAALVDSSPPRIGGNSTSAAGIKSKKPLLLVKKKNGISILFYHDRKLDRVNLTADLDGKWAIFKVHSLDSNVSWFESFPGFDLENPSTTKTETCIIFGPTAGRPVMKYTKKTFFTFNRHVCLRQPFFQEGKFENDKFELINFKPVLCEQKNAIYAVSEKSCTLLSPLEGAGSI